MGDSLKAPADPEQPVALYRGDASMRREHSSATKLQHADHVKSTLLYDALYPVGSIGSNQVRIDPDWQRPIVPLQGCIGQLGGQSQIIRQDVGSGLPPTGNHPGPSRGGRSLVSARTLLAICAQTGFESALYWTHSMMAHSAYR